MKANHVKILVIILLSSAFSLNAQNNTHTEIPLKKNAISFSILGVTPALGLVYERIISKKVSTELGVGFLSLGAGIKLYPLGIRMNKLLMHTGFTASASPWFQSGELTFEGQGFVAYIPLGISYFAKKYLNIVADFGPGTSFFNLEKAFIYGNLKIGVRF